jgi:Predicted acyltransferase
MKLITKHYNDLTTSELYALLQARASVFVVEQDCPYQDLDGKDLLAYHLWLEDEDGMIMAYLRVLPPGVSFEDCSIGRVLSMYRKEGFGSTLMKEAIKLIREKYGNVGITIEAQVQARYFYARQGFVKCSSEFLEDGIPHIRMKYEED